MDAHKEHGLLHILTETRGFKSQAKIHFLN